MGLRRFLFLAGIIVTAAISPMRAGGGASQDPVSGKWGQDGLPYLELKLDDGSTVSGTTYWRDGGRLETTAPIEIGRYDVRAATVILDGHARHPDGRVLAFHIEGRIDGDVISGTFRLGDRTGEFTFRRL